MHHDQACMTMIVYNMASIVIVEIVPMCSSVFTKIYKHFSGIIFGLRGLLIERNMLRMDRGTVVCMWCSRYWKECSTFMPHILHDCI